MEKYISLILIITIQLNNALKSQTVLTKTGYSKITNIKNEVIADSLLYCKYEFDKEDNKISEWKIVLDSTGNKKDEVYMLFDNKSKPLYYKNSMEETHYKHDSLGTIIELRTIKQNGDTILMSFNPTYLSGRLTENVLKINGAINWRSKYDYSNGKINEYINDKLLFQSSVTNKNGDWISREYFQQNGIHLTEIRIYNTENNIISEFEIKNTKLIVRTTHVYKDNLEIEEITENFEHGLTIRTKFNYN